MSEPDDLVELVAEEVGGSPVEERDGASCVGADDGRGRRRVEHRLGEGRLGVEVGQRVAPLGGGHGEGETGHRRGDEERLGQCTDRLRGHLAGLARDGERPVALAGEQDDDDPEQGQLGGEGPQVQPGGAPDEDGEGQEGQGQTVGGGEDPEGDAEQDQALQQVLQAPGDGGLRRHRDPQRRQREHSGGMGGGHRVGGREEGAVEGVGDGEAGQHAEDEGPGEGGEQEPTQVLQARPAVGGGRPGSSPTRPPRPPRCWRTRNRWPRAAAARRRGWPGRSSTTMPTSTMAARRRFGPVARRKATPSPAAGHQTATDDPWGANLTAVAPSTKMPTSTRAAATSQRRSSASEAFTEARRAPTARATGPHAARRVHPSGQVGMAHSCAARALRWGRSTVTGRGSGAGLVSGQRKGDAVTVQSSTTPAVRFTLNGASTEVAVEAGVSLLDLLRERLDLTGTKKGCNQGACGVCTVLVDGRRVLGCLTLVAQLDGRDVTTIEGVGTPEHPHDLQRAFIATDGFQCGYCTSGQICSALGMLTELQAGVPSAVAEHVAAQPDASDLEVRERMSGNLCRCGAYNGIVDAITGYAETADGRR